MEQTEFDSGKIQSLIGYNFKNPRLLQQAFTRRSFSQEHQGFEDNEILEFYGDAALNLYISRAMSEEFGKIENNQFVSEKNEGELSKIRSWSVNKERLSHCIQVLGLERFLFLGSSDIKNESWKSDSVKEDLFEAIVGAVAIDSDWNSDEIKTVCQNLFSISDFSENYIALLEEECEKHRWEKPSIRDDNFFARIRTANIRKYANPFYGFDLPYINPFPKEEKVSLRIRNLRNPVSDFNSAYGSTSTKASMLAAKKIYEWLLRRDKIQGAIEKIDENLAVNQLHELRQKGFIAEPVYNFSESHDKNGNPIWKCTCKLDEAEYPFEAEDASKKKVKQKVAAQALFFLVGSEIVINEEGDRINDN